MPDWLVAMRLNTVIALPTLDVARWPARCPLDSWHRGFIATFMLLAFEAVSWLHQAWRPSRCRLNPRHLGSTLKHSCFHDARTRLEPT